jgi:hypothetical protein
VKVGAALDAVESGRGGGTFYWASDGAEQMEWRRSPAVSAPSRQRFSKVKRGKRSGRDTELVWGKRRRLAGISIKLHPTTGGGDDGAWHGGALVGRVATARASEARRRCQRWAGLEWPGGPNATWADAERKQKNRDAPQGRLGRNGFGLR